MLCRYPACFRKLKRFYFSDLNSFSSDEVTNLVTNCTLIFPSYCYCRCLLAFRDYDLIDLISRFYFIDHIQPFRYFSETGMHSVEMRSVVPAMANKELRTACVFSRMCHAESSAVVILVSARSFAFDFVTGASGSCSVRAAALDHEIRDHTM